MEITYQRELNETWILLPEEEPAEEYACRLLEQNRCRHLLRLSRRQGENGTVYAFAVSRGNSLAHLYRMSPLDFPALRQLLLGISQAVEEAESCLLELHHLILQPDLIFAAPDLAHLSFCCHPGYRRDFFEQLRDLMRYCIRKIDHRDSRETETAYRLLEICEQQYYRFEDLLDAMGEAYAGRMEEASAAGAVPPQPVSAVSSPGRISGGVSLPEEFPETSLPAGPSDTGRPYRAWLRFLPSLLLLSASGCSALLVLWLRKTRGQWNWRFGMLSLLFAAAAVGALIAALRKPKEETEEPPARCGNGEGREREVPPVRHGTGTNRGAEFLRTGREAGETGPWEPEAPATTFLDGTMLLTSDTETVWRLIPRRGGGDEPVILRPLPFTVGKIAGEVSLLLDEPSVSRIHARIEELDGQLVICDCRSTNGTRVNGIRLRPEERYPLQSGDEIRFAETAWRLEAGERHAGE